MLRGGEIVGQLEAGRERGEELRLDGSDRDVSAIATDVGRIERRSPVEQVRAARIGPRAQRGQSAHERRERRGAIDHRGVDHLSGSRALAFEQGCEHADGQQHPATTEVREVVRDRWRRKIRGPDGVQRAGERRVVDVVPCGRGQRTRLPPTGHARIDQARMGGAQVLGTEPEPFHRPGAEALDEHVRIREEPTQDRGSIRVLEVQHERTPPAPHRHVGQHCGVSLSTRTVDADHVRSEIGQQHDAVRRRPQACQLDDSDACERSETMLRDRHRPPLPALASRPWTLRDRHSAPSSRAGCSSP